MSGQTPGQALREAIDLLESGDPVDPATLDRLHRVALAAQAQPAPAADSFGGHEFAYESRTDLFRCTRCHVYEVSWQAGDLVRTCPGEPPEGDGPIEVNAW